MRQRNWKGWNLTTKGIDMEITLNELLEATGSKNATSHSFIIGEQYLIRTVTFFYTGKLKSVTDTDLVLSDAAWIADTGRFHDCLVSGDLNEVEPFLADAIVPRTAIIDATLWSHKLPRDQK